VSAHPGLGPTPTQRLRKLVSLERDDIWVVVIYAIAVGLVSLAVPIAVQALVNTVAFAGLLQPLVVLVVLVFIGLLGAGALRTLQARVIEVLQQRLFVRAAHDASRGLTRAHIDAFQDHHGAELMNRFFDIVTVQKAVAAILVDGLSVVLQAAIALLLLAFYHPALLAFDVFLILAISFIVFGLGQNGPSTAIKESKTKYSVAAWLEEVASSTRAFKSPGAAELAFGRADALATEYVHARRKHFKVLLRQIISSYVLQALAVSGLLGLGGWLVMQGQLTLGQLVAAELIVTSVVAGLTKFGKYLETFYDLVASIDKLGAIEDLEAERADGVERRPGEGPASLSLEGLSFSVGAGRPVVEDVTLDIQAGQHVAVLGGDASGKSTLVDLIYGLRAPSTGRVVLDGLDIRTLALGDLRKDVAIAGHPELFDGTLMENVCMGRPGLHAEDVALALEIAALDHDAASLEGGLTTPLGHAGRALTASQAARLMIARAVLARPRLLVIDEVLDGLDDETVTRVVERLERSVSFASLLVFTSRREIARKFSRVARLRGGRLTTDVEVSS
jgi:putative ABC transport system ATP-binding protein